MISLFLIDDHPLILRGLRDLFAHVEDVTVVGDETDGSRALDAIAACRPQVVLMDLGMPGVSGMDLIRQIMARCPDSRIVVLTMHASIAYAWQSFRHGAIGYVLKCADIEELVHALHLAIRGRRYLSSQLSQKELEQYDQKMQGSAVDPFEALTGREKEVLRLAAEGANNAQIAARLGIGVRTVETHRANLMRKLELRGQTELVRYAIQRGILPPV